MTPRWSCTCWSPAAGNLFGTAATSGQSRIHWRRRLQYLCPNNLDLKFFFDFQVNFDHPEFHGVSKEARDFIKSWDFFKFSIWQKVVCRTAGEEARSTYDWKPVSWSLLAQSGICCFFFFFKKLCKPRWYKKLIQQLLQQAREDEPDRQVTSSYPRKILETKFVQLLSCNDNDKDKTLDEKPLRDYQSWRGFQINLINFRRMRKFMARHRWRKAIRAVRKKKIIMKTKQSGQISQNLFTHNYSQQEYLS